MFPGCRCLLRNPTQPDKARVENVLARSGWRCLACRSPSDSLGFHSLLPVEELIEEIAVVLCYECHKSVADGRLAIEENLVSQRLLFKWQEGHPEAMTLHRSSFPVEWDLAGINQKEGAS